jgi:hypothetical protein
MAKQLFPDKTTVHMQRLHPARQIAIWGELLIFIKGERYN